MQYDARPKEANDESALLTTSSMPISGPYCHNYGQWEHEDSVNYALSIFQQLSLTSKLHVMYILCSGFLTFIKYINYLLNSW